MRDMDFERAMAELENAGLPIDEEDRLLLAAAPVGARAQLVSLLARAMQAGATRRENPPTCNEILAADYGARPAGRHAKGGA